MLKMHPIKKVPVYADPSDPDSDIIGKIDINENRRDNLKEKIMKDISKKGKYERLDGYRTGRVYDISQTQHIDPKTGELDPDHDNLDEIIKLVSHGDKHSLLVRGVPHSFSKLRNCRVDLFSELDPDHDNLDEIINRDKILETQLADVKDITAAINDTFFIHNYSSRCDRSDSEDIFQSIHKYAEYKLHNDPTSITGIKSSGVSKGAVAEAETLIGAGLICEHIGISDALDKVGIQLTKILKPNNALENVENFKGYLNEGGMGRKAIFKAAFDRGSALAADFNKVYDKTLEEITKTNNKKKEAEYER